METLVRCLEWGFAGQAVVHFPDVAMQDANGDAPSEIDPPVAHAVVLDFVDELGATRGKVHWYPSCF